MTEIPEELVERVRAAIGPVRSWDGDPMSHNLTKDELSDIAQAAIRAVLDWQAKEWVEIPRLDRP